MLKNIGCPTKDTVKVYTSVNNFSGINMALLPMHCLCHRIEVESISSPTDSRIWICRQIKAWTDFDAENDTPVTAGSAD